MPNAPTATTPDDCVLSSDGTGPAATPYASDCSNAGTSGAVVQLMPSDETQAITVGRCRLLDCPTAMKVRPASVTSVIWMKPPNRREVSPGARVQVSPSGEVQTRASRRS